MDSKLVGTCSTVSEISIAYSKNFLSEQYLPNLKNHSESCRSLHFPTLLENHVCRTWYSDSLTEKCGKQLLVRTPFAPVEKLCESKTSVPYFFLWPKRHLDTWLANDRAIHDCKYCEKRLQIVFFVPGKGPNPPKQRKQSREVEKTPCRTEVWPCR